MLISTAGSVTYIVYRWPRYCIRIANAAPNIELMILAVGGATTANRLTESAGVDVLLLEAGGASVSQARLLKARTNLSEQK